jgi:hypothetical protein
MEGYTEENPMTKECACYIDRIDFMQTFMVVVVAFAVTVMIATVVLQVQVWVDRFALPDEKELCEL